MEAIKARDMYYFGMKWINGNLYRELADNGHQQNQAEIDRIMAIFENSAPNI